MSVLVKTQKSRGHKTDVPTEKKRQTMKILVEERSRSKGGKIVKMKRGKQQNVD